MPPHQSDFFGITHDDPTYIDSAQLNDVCDLLKRTYRKNMGLIR